MAKRKKMIDDDSARGLGSILEESHLAPVGDLQDVNLLALQVERVRLHMGHRVPQRPLDVLILLRGYGPAVAGGRVDSGVGRATHLHEEALHLVDGALIFGLDVRDHCSRH